MVNIRKVVDLGYLFAGGGVLDCRCAACGHTDRLTAQPLLKRFGAGCPIARLERRMSCTRCGARDATVRAVWPPDPEPGGRQAD